MIDPNSNSNNLFLKVCGMRSADNIREIAALNPDFLGFIFYSPSSRFIGEKTWELEQFLKTINIAKIGVFVNAELKFVVQKAKDFGLWAVQLHGGESLGYCRECKRNRLKVIKVFSVKNKLPIEEMKEFDAVVDYFLLDTKGTKHGGNGVAFDWDCLEEYNFKTPFFLSGGIASEDAELVQNLAKNNSQLIGADINSKFEISPALKSPNMVQKFWEELQNSNDL